MWLPLAKAAKWWIYYMLPHTGQEGRVGGQNMWINYLHWPF